MSLTYGPVKGGACEVLLRTYNEHYSDLTPEIIIGALGDALEYDIDYTVVRLLADLAKHLAPPPDILVDILVRSLAYAGDDERNLSHALLGLKSFVPTQAMVKGALTLVAHRDVYWTYDTWCGLDVLEEIHKRSFRVFYRDDQFDFRSTQQLARGEVPFQNARVGIFQRRQIGEYSDGADILYSRPG